MIVSTIVYDMSRGIDSCEDVFGASSNRCGEDKALETRLAVVFPTTGQIQGHIYRGS